MNQLPQTSLYRSSNSQENFSNLGHIVKAELLGAGREPCAPHCMFQIALHILTSTIVSEFLFPCQHLILWDFNFFLFDWWEGINQWSLVPIECQQESPIWGVVKKEPLFSVNSSIVLQCNYEIAELYNSTAVRQPWGKAPLLLDSSALPALL